MGKSRRAPEPPPAAVSMQWVRDRIAESQVKERSEILSAINKLIGILGPLESIPGKGERLRELFKAVTTEQHGLKPSYWTQVKNKALRALRELGIDNVKGRDVDLGRGWLDLFACVPPPRRRLLRSKMTKLAKWATAEGLSPQQLTPAAFERFEQHALSAQRARPREQWLKACNAWDDAVTEFPFWPQVPSGCEKKRLWYTREMTVYPPSLARDIDEMFEARRAGARWFRRRAPIALETEEGERHRLRRYLHALVEAGAPIGHLQRLEDCFTVDYARSALNWIKDERHGGDDCLDLYNTALMTRAIATIRCQEAREPFDCLVDEFADDKLFKRSAARLKGLARLANPTVRVKIFSVAHLVLEEFERKEALLYREAARIEAAFALQIAWATGAAPKRLIDFELGKELRFARDDGLEVHAGSDRWMRAPEIIERLAKLYFAKARGRLHRFESKLAFPGQKQGSKKNPISLSRAITRLVEEKSGQRFTALEILQALTASYDLEDADERQALMDLIGYRTPQPIEVVRRAQAKKRIQDEHARQVTRGKHGSEVSLATSTRLAGGNRNSMARGAKKAAAASQRRTWMAAPHEPAAVDQTERKIQDLPRGGDL